MTSERSYVLCIFILSGIYALPANEPAVVNKNYSRDDTNLEYNGTVDEWFLHGFECCNNIVTTNHTESPGLQELNMVPDIIYSGNI